jgi:hypothetical protein
MAHRPCRDAMAITWSLLTGKAGIKRAFFDRNADRVISELRRKPFCHSSSWQSGNSILVVAGYLPDWGG